MKKFGFTCTCGEKVSVTAVDRIEALMKIKIMMTPEMVEKHINEQHQAEIMSSIDDLEMLTNTTVELH